MMGNPMMGNPMSQDLMGQSMMDNSMLSQIQSQVGMSQSGGFNLKNLANLNSTAILK